MHGIVSYLHYMWNPICACSVSQAPASLHGRVRIIEFDEAYLIDFFHVGAAPRGYALLCITSEWISMTLSTIVNAIPKRMSNCTNLPTATHLIHVHNESCVDHDPHSSFAVDLIHNARNAFHSRKAFIQAIIYAVIRTIASVLLAHIT